MDDNEKVDVKPNETTEVDVEAVTDEKIKPAPDMNPSKKKKKRLKIAAYVVSALILLFVVVIFSLGSVVKVAVNNVLPKVTGTPCSMGSCTFNPILGKVSISNLKIGNPEGYAKKNAFELGRLVVDVGVSSLFSDMIEIDEITVKGMNVDFEVKATETNLSTIKGNIDKFTKSDAGEEKATEESAPEEKTPAEKPASSKKLRIHLVQFSDNSISIGTAGETASIPFAAMTIKEIGSGPEGATVGEVSSKIFIAIYDAVVKTAKENGIDSLKKSAGDALDKVKGWFGGGKK